MEGLTDLPAKDGWDFGYLGMSNHPFIKENYPHCKGICGWQDAGDQVAIVVSATIYYGTMVTPRYGIKPLS
eukprot:2602748-Ditylum_brightwellii.AAC.1